MDIARTRNKIVGIKRYRIPLAVGAVLIAAFGISRVVGSSGYSIDGDKIIVGEVKRGDFSVQVRGIGTLVPKNIQWLAANVDGHVERINVEAGAEVHKGDVIVTLNNPKLHETLEESYWEIEAQRKEHRSAEMTLESQLSDVRAEASNAELEYQSAKLKLEAEGKLVGEGIVSRITYGQSELAAQQAQRRIASKRLRVSKMEANLAAMLDAHSARLNKLQKAHEQIQQQIEDLQVRARIDGVVQEMQLKLGQQVVQGSQVARIVPHGDLIALLDVQEFQVRDIALGQAVTIDTRSSKLKGKVTRIDPAVVNGVVKVEVTFAAALPPEARPDLSVEGVIDVERKKNTLFVERPSFAQSYSTATLFVLDGDTAIATKVQLGRASTRQIEVLKGLEPGDRVVVSDTSAWEGQSSVDIE